MKTRKNKKGFTIVELVIVIGVIGILSAILIPTFVNLTNKANTVREQEEVRNAYVAYSIDAQDGKLYNEVTGATAFDVTSVLAIDKVAVKRGDDYFTYDTEKSEWKKRGGTGDSYTPGAAVGTVPGDPADSYKFNGCYIYNK